MGNNKKKVEPKIRPLPAALRKKAEEEINETPGRMETEIKLLQDWIKQQPHLRKVRTTEQWLVAFLRGCKYNTEKAKSKFDQFYSLKSAIPEFLANRDPFDHVIQKVLKAGVFLPVRNCTRPDSPRVCISRIGPLTQQNLLFSDIIKVCLMIVEILLMEDDNFTIAGEDVIADLKGISFKAILQFTPSMARKIAECSQKALSVRLKSMHILNPPLGVGPGIALVTMFMGAKMKKRIQNHGHGPKFESMYKDLGKSVLPIEYGGSDGTVQELIDHWKRKVESYRDWFTDTNAYSDESKRVKD